MRRYLVGLAAFVLVTGTVFAQAEKAAPKKEDERERRETRERAGTKSAEAQERERNERENSKGRESRERRDGDRRETVRRDGDGRRERVIRREGERREGERREGERREGERRDGDRREAVRRDAERRESREGARRDPRIQPLSDREAMVIRMLQELRKEVGSLRREVAQLRAIVRGEGGERDGNGRAERDYDRPRDGDRVVREGAREGAAPKRPRIGGSPEAAVAGLKRVFNTNDRNRDGFIDLNEVISPQNRNNEKVRAQAAKMFKAADTNGDNKWSFDEFVAAVNSQKRRESDRRDRPREDDGRRDGDKAREGDRPREGARGTERKRDGDRPREAERRREGDSPREREGAKRDAPRRDGDR